MTTLTSAFFGSYVNPLRQLANCTTLKAAYCDHDFKFIDVFNRVPINSNVRLAGFLNRAHMLTTVREWPDMDVLLVAGFSYRLPLEVINKFRWVINMHPGDLQNNRGPCPVQHSILNQETHIHITLHQINSEEFDSGPVLLESRLPVDYSRPFRDLHTRVDHLAGAMVLDVVTALRLGWAMQVITKNYSPDSYRPRLPAGLINDMIESPSLSEFLKQIQPAAQSLITTQQRFSIDFNSNAILNHSTPGCHIDNVKN